MGILEMNEGLGSTYSLNWIHNFLRMLDYFVAFFLNFVKMEPGEAMFLRAKMFMLTSRGVLPARCGMC